MEHKAQAQAKAKAKAKPPSCVVERVNQSKVAGCRLLVDLETWAGSSLECLARFRFVGVDHEAVGFGA